MPETKAMKAVTRYHCEHCGKDFRTPNRHSCKMNPELKNCYSCEHLNGWDEDTIEDCTQWGCIKTIIPDCGAKESNPDEVNIQDLKVSCYNLQCSSWELRK